MKEEKPYRILLRIRNAGVSSSFLRPANGYGFDLDCLSQAVFEGLEDCKRVKQDSLVARGTSDRCLKWWAGSIIGSDLGGVSMVPNYKGILCDRSPKFSKGSVAMIEDVNTFETMV